MWGGAAFIVRERGIESGFIFLGTENVSTTMGKFTDSFKHGVSMRAFYRFFYKLDSDNDATLAEAIMHNAYKINLRGESMQK